MVRSFTIISARPFLSLAHAEHSVIIGMSRRSVTGKRTGIIIRLELDELRSLRWPSCPPTLTERSLGLQHQHSPMFSNMRSWAGKVAFIARGTKAQPLIQRDCRHHVIGNFQKHFSAASIPRQSDYRTCQLLTHSPTSKIRRYLHRYKPSFS